MLQPKKTKYKKMFRGNLKGISKKGKDLYYGEFGLQVLTSGWLTERQIEAGRKCLSRECKKLGKIYIRVFPDKSVTMRSEGTRMGSGKGSVSHWVAPVKPLKIIYELSGIPEDVAIKALKNASHKMPVKTKIISR